MAVAGTGCRQHWRDDGENRKAQPLYSARQKHQRNGGGRSQGKDAAGDKEQCRGEQERGRAVAL